MKREYDDEQDIVDHAADIDDADVCFYPAESTLAHRFLSALRAGGFDKRERPDFEDNGASLLLEAMRVDDHAGSGKKDKTRAREAALLREIEAAGLDVPPDVRVLALADSGLPAGRDHSYQAYVQHFTSTVSQHARNAEIYRAERQGHDLGFIVFDESTSYFEGLGAFGRPGAGRLHVWFNDSVFVDAILQSGADCVFWMAPYKRLDTIQTGVVPLPAMTVIDVALLSRPERVVYDPGRMVSSED
ncbi:MULTISPECIES: hypothetical protein [unclassified Leucobacter]|uniref:hypothetical protein n=1 Tax=unclassified Leucobacter TaxID=2621730 RepID=UPI00165D7872|nr:MULTISPECIES: hypothetical protein [unclassified Leucobacter]MBC9936941.1 hypothetical protein [Leucobacter sp. cx-87]